MQAPAATADEVGFPIVIFPELLELIGEGVDPLGVVPNSIDQVRSCPSVVPRLAQLLFCLRLRYLT